MNQSCRVCGEVAAGYHFGAFTCEGCKSFFGRTYNNRSSIGECKNNNSCVINKKNRTSCKSCRLKKCFSVGMSKSGSRYGRRSNWFKIHCLLQDQQQTNHHQDCPLDLQQQHHHHLQQQPQVPSSQQQALQAASLPPSVCAAALDLHQQARLASQHQQLPSPPAPQSQTLVGAGGNAQCPLEALQAQQQQQSQSSAASSSSSAASSTSSAAALAAAIFMLGQHQAAQQQAAAQQAAVQQQQLDNLSQLASGATGGYQNPAGDLNSLMAVMAAAFQMSYDRR